MTPSDWSEGEEPERLGGEKDQPPTPNLNTNSVPENPDSGGPILLSRNVRPGGKTQFKELKLAVNPGKPL